MQLAAEIVAAGAFEHRGLMPPVALRAFDLSEMGIVGIDFEAVCLLGKFFVASAVAGQTLLFFDRRGVRRVRVAGFTLQSARDMAVREILDGCRGFSSRHGGGREKSEREHHDRSLHRSLLRCCRAPRPFSQAEERALSRVAGQSFPLLPIRGMALL